MTENVDLKIVARAEDEASPVLRRLLRDLRRFEKLGAKLAGKPAVAFGLAAEAEKALAAHRRIAAVQKKATTASAKAEKATDDSLRRQLAFGRRMQVQKQNEQRQQQALTAKALRDRLAFDAAMIRQRDKQRRQDEVDSRRRDAATRRADVMTGRRFLERLRFADRMNRQRLREERAAAAENRRQQAASHRAERHHKAHLAKLDRQSRQRRRELIRTGARTYEGTSEVARSAGVAGLAVGAGAALAARRSIGVELANDDAMRNMQAYGGLDWESVKRLRSTWAEDASIALGSTVANLLTTYTDALKAGIPNAGAKDFTALPARCASNARRREPPQTRP